MTRPPREAYARGYYEHDGCECTVGIEWRESAEFSNLKSWASACAYLGASLMEHQTEAVAVSDVEGAIRERYPDRAYFIETEREGAGVQVYQPFGMPRNA